VAITVSIVEDDRSMRENLAALLANAPGLRFLAGYADGKAALRGLAADPPDVAVVDINLPGMSGIECVAKLKAERPRIHFLMLTAHEDTDLIFNSLRAGARGYLLKKMAATELVQAIEQVHTGGAPMSLAIARRVVDHFNELGQAASEIEKLAPRERDVLTLLSQGYLYKEISDKLGISQSTVRTYIQRTYEKLHVQSRTEAAAKFRLRLAE